MNSFSFLYPHPILLTNKRRKTLQEPGSLNVSLYSSPTFFKTFFYFSTLSPERGTFLRLNHVYKRVEIPLVLVYDIEGKLVISACKIQKS